MENLPQVGDSEARATGCPVESICPYMKIPRWIFSLLFIGWTQLSVIVRDGPTLNILVRYARNIEINSASRVCEGSLFSPLPVGIVSFVDVL